ncbi:MAG: ferritin-like domain-containing protein [Candidatus Rokubacteria bacterium]|nr:ferritin-like domain-containing protein [Candidatus Rokubacteria bacterium]
MPHPLEGRFSVDHSARLIRNYRYAVERALRALGGWIALTPEISAKLLMGRHVWDLAQHADAFGKRLPELRAPAQVSEPPNPAFAAFMDALEEPEGKEQTVERLVGVYRVLKPHLLATYRDHVARANPVYEPPTRRILERCIEDEARHIAAGETILRHLASTPALDERAAVWQGRLEGLLAAAGGVTGDGLPQASAAPPTATQPPELDDDAREWIRLERTVTVWPIPDDLRATLQSFGDALLARDAAAPRRWLAAGAAWDVGAESSLYAVKPAAHRVVAFARVGHHRLVKLSFEGADGAATLLTRWVPAADGWRVAALEVARVDAARPALPPP